uniref:C2H2-type domain-containing protein n=1 Tax=Heliothis virescens TaxID=7102 RepID=A0A2A4K5M3_HELVI
MRRRRNLQIIFNNTSIIPFKWRGKYLCFYCSKDISEYTELRKHTKSHGNCSIKDHSLKVLKGGQNMEIKIDVSDISCEICTEPFPSFDEVITHLFVKHKLEYDKGVDMAIEEYKLVDLSCICCDEKFTYFGYLVSHVNNNHPKNCLICDKCNQKFNKKRDLFSHMKNYHREGGYQCELCPQTFSSLNILRKHRNNRHLTRCNICHLKLPSAALKQKHIELEHPDDGSLQCDTCLKEFHTKQGLRMHNRKCKGEEIFEIAIKKEEYVAMDLDQNYDDQVKRPSVKQIRENIVIVINMSTAIPFNFYKNKFNCFYCSKDFPDSDSMREHTVMEHPVCDVKEKCIRKCRESVACVKIDVSSLAYLESRTAKHSDCDQRRRNLQILLNNTTLIPFKWRGKYMCFYCGDAYDTHKSLAKHTKAHGPCSLKDRAIKLVKSAEIEIKVDMSDISCEICAESFNDIHDIVEHLISSHQLPYDKKVEILISAYRLIDLKCRVCGQCFDYLRNLISHMNKEHPSNCFPCPDCRLKFNKKRDLESHIRFYHRDTHPCTKCTMKFSTNAALQRHRSRAHSSTCNLCFRIFSSDKKRLAHLKSEHDSDENKCGFCYEVLTTKQAFIRHALKCQHNPREETSTPVEPDNKITVKEIRMSLACIFNMTTALPFKYCMNKFRCFYCPESFDSCDDLKEHSTTQHPYCDISFKCMKLKSRYDGIKIKCMSCGLRFASLSLLQKHILVDHPQSEDNMKCSYCSKEFHSSIGLMQHISKCKVKLLSQEEPNSSLTEDSIEPKKKQNVLQIRQNIQCVLNMSTAVPFKFFSKYSCFYCSKKFVEFDELRQHTTLEHPVCDLKAKCMKKCKGERVSVKIDISDLACKVCGLPMPNLEDLVNHLIETHKAKYDTSITGCLEPYRLIKDNMPCPICPDTVFRYFGILLRHMSSVHSNNNRICDFCGRSFRNAANLNVHITYAHTGSCECDVCGAKYKNQWCLARHRARTHNAKDHKCPKCPEKFQSQYHTQKHLIKIHNIGHKCSYCGKMFTRNSFMKDHVRRTHLKEKNIPCSICNEKFFDNYLLRMHMVKHEGDRKFTCTVCGKAFLRRSNLSSHMEMHKKYGHVQV